MKLASIKALQTDERRESIGANCDVTVRVWACPTRKSTYADTATGTIGVSRVHVF